MHPTTFLEKCSCKIYENVFLQANMALSPASVFVALSALITSFKIIYFQKVKCLLCYSPKPRRKVSILIYQNWPIYLEFSI